MENFKTKFKYVANIRNKEYEVSQGFVINEELNETLDSATIKISHIEEIKNLEQYERVIIKDLNGNFKRVFYINKFTFEIINFKDRLFKYTIYLFGETKLLDNVLLPNVSITPSITSDKNNIYFYINYYVSEYAKDKKIIQENKQVLRVKNIKLDNSLRDIFAKTICPEVSFNTPTLREVLNFLFSVKDYIPYVENGYLKARYIGSDILKTTDRIDLFNNHTILNVYGSKTSDDYATNLKRQYTNAICSSDKGYVQRIPNLSQRNREKGIFRFADFLVETNFPIYTVEKFVIKASIRIEVSYKENNQDKSTIIDRLTSYDITPLVVSKAVYNSKSTDFEAFKNKIEGLLKREVTLYDEIINTLQQYKFGCVTYDIGDSSIANIGTTYEAWNFWGNEQRSILDLIYTFIIKGTDKISIVDVDNIVRDLQKQYPSWQNIFLKFTSVNTFGGQTLKSFTYDMEYIPMFNGMINYIKDDFSKTEVDTQDGANKGLSVLDSESIYQQSKIKRFGALVMSVTARCEDINDILPLGGITTDDNVIYHRDISFYNNFISVTYNLMKGAVLKNYFTSVNSQYRPYQLISYNNSITRSECDTYFIVLSRNKYNFDNDYDIGIGKLSDFIALNYSTEQDYFNYIRTSYALKKNNEYYILDTLKYIYNSEMILSTSMYDNASLGIYISKPYPNYNDKDTSAQEQSWYMQNDTDGHMTNFYMEYIVYNSTDSLSNASLLPKITNNNKIYRTLVSKYYRLKDNKELLNHTTRFIYKQEGTEEAYSFFKFNDEWFRNTKIFNNKTALNIKDISTSFNMTIRLFGFSVGVVDDNGNIRKEIGTDVIRYGFIGAVMEIPHINYITKDTLFLYEKTLNEIDDTSYQNEQISINARGNSIRRANLTTYGFQRTTITRPVGGMPKVECIKLYFKEVTLYEYDYESAKYKIFTHEGKEFNFKTDNVNEMPYLYLLNTYGDLLGNKINNTYTWASMAPNLGFKFRGQALPDYEVITWQGNETFNKDFPQMGLKEKLYSKWFFSPNNCYANNVSNKSYVPIMTIPPVSTINLQDDNIKKNVTVMYSKQKYDFNSWTELTSIEQEDFQTINNAKIVIKQNDDSITIQRPFELEGYYYFMKEVKRDSICMARFLFAHDLQEIKVNVHIVKDCITTFYENDNIDANIKFLHPYTGEKLEE